MHDPKIGPKKYHDPRSVTSCKTTNFEEFWAYILSLYIRKQSHFHNEILVKMRWNWFQIMKNQSQREKASQVSTFNQILLNIVLPIVHLPNPWNYNFATNFGAFWDCEVMKKHPVKNQHITLYHDAMMSWIHRHFNIT